MEDLFSNTPDEKRTSVGKTEVLYKNVKASLS